MISVKTQQFESIRSLLLRSRCEFAVASESDGAGFSMKADLPLGEWANEGDRPELQLSFVEDEHGTMATSCMFPVGFDANGFGDSDDGDTLYTGFVNSPWSGVQIVERDKNSKMCTGGKTLIEIDAASFSAVLKKGPDANGIPYLFNAFQLPSLSVSSIFLIGDFSDNLALRLEKGPFGKCIAKPLLRV